MARIQIRRTRTLTAFESQCVQRHASSPNEVTRTGRRLYTTEQVQEAVATERGIRREKEAAAQKVAIESDKEYFTSEEFKQEVIEAIVADGATFLQAQGRTRDQARLFNEARELGLM